MISYSMYNLYYEQNEYRLNNTIWLYNNDSTKVDYVDSFTQSADGSQLFPYSIFTSSEYLIGPYCLDGCQG